MESFNELLRIIGMLLGENGCPWDKSQTFESLRGSLLEECNEVVEAVNQKDNAAIAEELGDVLMNVLLYAKIAEGMGAFTVEDVIESISRKLVRRHSHIFGGDVAKDVEDVKKIWERNKAKEKMGGTVEIP